MLHKSMEHLPAIHPGQILAEDLSEAGISINELGRALRVPVNRISEIVNRRRGISAETALRLSRYFGTSPQYWMNLQTAYEIEVAQREAGQSIEREVLPRSA